MGWADKYIERLQKDGVVKFRPQGNSMSGWIEPGQLVTVEHYGGEILEEEQIVLCTVKGNQYLHIIYDVDITKNTYLIGNAKGRMNGWIPASKIHGLCTKIV